MNEYLFLIIAVAFFVGAIVLLYWGLWGDRTKGTMRCPKCWHDMSETFEAGMFETSD